MVGQEGPSRSMLSRVGDDVVVEVSRAATDLTSGESERLFESGGRAPAVSAPSSACTSPGASSRHRAVPCPPTSRAGSDCD